MKVVYWNRGVDESILQASETRLNAAANVLADEIKSKLRSVAPMPQSRPVYKTGPYAGEAWTAREAGALLSTVRVVQKHSNKTNFWVVVGSYRAYYAQIFENAKLKGRKFFRPALRSARPKMKAVLEGMGGK